MPVAKVSDVIEPIKVEPFSRKGEIRLKAETLEVGKAFLVSKVKRNTILARLRDVKSDTGFRFVVNVIGQNVFQVVRVK